MRGMKRVPCTSCSMSLFSSKASPTTEMRKNTAIDPSSLWKYLSASGMNGFDNEDKCVVKQFAHGIDIFP